MRPGFIFILSLLGFLFSACGSAQAVKAPEILLKSSIKQLKSSETSGEFYISLPDASLMRVETFRPACQSDRQQNPSSSLSLAKPNLQPFRAVAIIFPGYRRNSKTYRDNIKTLARALCVLVYVPHFSERDFPIADYQHGGQGLAVALPLLSAIKAQAEQISGRKTLPMLLIGHSAGAQYLSRLAAYGSLSKPTKSRHLTAFQTAIHYVLISAGTYTEASMRFAPPYGFKTLGQMALKAYLTQSIHIIVGGADTGQTAHLNYTPPAMAQGTNRLTRAMFFWQQGQTEAAHYAIKCRWTLQIIAGLGHSSTALLSSPLLIDNLYQILQQP